MIKDIEISFYEPYTGVYVKGVKPMFFKNKQDYDNWVGKTYVELIKRYGYGVFVREVANE